MVTGVYLVGLSERAARRGAGWDLLGVTDILVVPFFPISLSGFQIVLLFDNEAMPVLLSNGISVRIEDESNAEDFGEITLTGSIMEAEEAPAVVSLSGFEEARPVEKGQAGTLAPLRLSSMSQTLIVLSCPPVAVKKPTDLKVTVVSGGESLALGTVRLAWRQPAPISPDEMRAILTRPSAVKNAILSIECQSCHEKLGLVVSMNPNDSITREDRADFTAIMRVEDASEEWICSCNRMRVPLKYARLGLHDLLRQPIASNSQLTSFSPLYEKSRIEGIISNLATLLDSEPREEDVQKFLERFPLVWSFLRPKRILVKPPILTQYVADYGVLSQDGVLHLIEIERPAISLITKNGRIAAQVQGAADQLRDWAQVVDQERSATLGQMGLDPKSVADVRYLLIAGRTRELKAQHANKLRRGAFGGTVTYMSYDDLLAYLGSIRLHLPTA